MRSGQLRAVVSAIHPRMDICVLAVVFCQCLAITSVEAQGTVSVLNLRNGGPISLTGIEVGNTTRIAIRGATPNADITFTQKKNNDPVGGPFPAGQTDASGNRDIDNVMTSDLVASYEQHWYVNVNGTPTELMTLNPDSFYVRLAPRLPSFTVYANFTAMNCSTQSMSFSGCNTGNQPRHWVRSPVTYR